MDNIAALNKLKLTDVEKTSVQAGFYGFYNNAGIFDGINTDGIQPMVYCNDIVNVFREDKAEQRFTREQILEGAPEVENGCYVVPKVVADE